AEQAKALKGDLPALRDFAAQHKMPLYELGPAAILMPAPQTSAGLPRQYEPYRVSRDLIAYPGDFADRLLRLKDKPIGATDVLPDQPRQHFYIVSLTRKIDATEAEFDRSFFAAGRGVTESDTLFQNYERQQAEGFRSMVMEQLRLDAGLQVNTENLVR